MVEWGPICPSPPRNLYCHHYDLGIWWYGRGLVAAKYNLHYLNDFLKSERQLEWQDNQWNGHLHSALSAPPSSLQCTATGRCLQMRGRTLTRRVEKNHMIGHDFSRFFRLQGHIPPLQHERKNLHCKPISKNVSQQWLSGSLIYSTQ